MCSWHWGPGRGGGMRTDPAGDPQEEEESAHKRKEERRGGEAPVPVTMLRAASPKQAAHTLGLGHLFSQESSRNRRARLWKQTAKVDGHLL